MADLEYLDFDLSIEGSEGKYIARVLDSPSGQAESAFSQPFSELELENFYLRVGRPRQSVRRLGSPEMQAAQQLGARLFEATFGNEVYANFRASLSKAQDQNKGLRVRLRVNTPDLINLPWEYLYNPRLDRFLSLSVETPIVRYLDLPQRPRALIVEPPLKILAMISSPKDFPPLDVEREWHLLKEALSGLEDRGLVSLERLERADLGSVQRRLRRGDMHIFHYIGHGKFDEGTQEGLLLFEDEHGRGRPLSGNYLGTILRDHRPLRLVVLNACEGARTSSEDPYAGVAHPLVRQGIPAVVAMQFEITDRAAITFAREFYGALADGYPVDAALTEARKAIFAEGNDIEWGTPVYFTRAPDGRVFDLAEGAFAGAFTHNETAFSPSVVDADLEERLEQAYLDGSSAYWTQDWATARRKFQEVAELRPDYKDVAVRLAEIERRIEITELYDRAQEAMQAQNWRVAETALAALAARSPGYKDVDSLLAEASKQGQLADLYAEARQLHLGRHWQAIISVFDRIHALQADFPDEENLLANAERELAAQERKHELDALYQRALGAMDLGKWDQATTDLERLLGMDADYPNAVDLLERARAEQEAAEQQAEIAPLVNIAKIGATVQDWESLNKKPGSARTSTKIATFVIALLCSCPGLVSICWGAFAVWYSFNPRSEFDTFGSSSDRMEALFTGLGALCFGVICLAIPFVLGYFILRQRPKAVAPVYNKPIPPAS